MSTNIKNSQNNIVKKLNETRSRYEGSFTVHGINHINSGTVLEKVLWILCVLGALVGSVFMTYGLFDSYLKKDVDTKISIKENIRTRLPTIYICSGGALSYLDSYIDCSSTVSKSYDEFHCQIMNKTCPKFCDGGRCSNLAEHLRLVPTCPPELYGQCVALNAEGDVTQSVLFPSDSYIPETRNKENFPYEMYIRPPGETDPLRGRSFLMGNRRPECFLWGPKKSCLKNVGCQIFSDFFVGSQIFSSIFFKIQFFFCKMLHRHQFRKSGSYKKKKPLTRIGFLPNFP